MRKPHIELPKEKIAEFCKKWKIREFSLFGSVLREDFRPDSDIDVLVTFSEKMQNIPYSILSTWKMNSRRFSDAKWTSSAAGVSNPAGIISVEMPL